MSQTPTFKNPPVVEFVLGVQFSPLVKFTSGHFGLFWQQLGLDEWHQPEDGPPIPDSFELFDSADHQERGSVRLRIGGPPPMGRFVLHHKLEPRLIQLQPTRFHLNWRSREDIKPSYESLISTFMETYERLGSFVKAQGLGELIPNQWEITYIDSYPQGVYWNTPQDWPEVIPGLFGTLKVTDEVQLDHRAAEWSFIIPPNRGRLHISASLGRWQAKAESTLLVDMTARGPVGGTGPGTLREGLDLGHKVSVESFLKMTSAKAHAKFGAKG